MKKPKRQVSTVTLTISTKITRRNLACKTPQWLDPKATTQAQLNKTIHTSLMVVSMQRLGTKGTGRPLSQMKPPIVLVKAFRQQMSAKTTL